MTAPKQIRAGLLPVIAEWIGPKLVRRDQGAEPLRLQLAPGTRIVLMLNPRTDFPALVRGDYGLAW